MKKVSIITLCFNQLENSTKLFIESLYKFTDPELFELIIVNNNSTDGTFEYLENIKEAYNNIKIIHNDKNLGYAGGNNQGLKIASGEYLFLLNNDLLFTPNWLQNMIKILDKNKKIGILAPMTNFCGLEKQLVKNAKSLTVENYINLYNQEIKADNTYSYNDKIIFFCCGMRRDIFEKVGFLDENFGMAWFEDDDYSLRVLYAGYKPAIANGIFVYHNHSQTSSKLYDSTSGKEIFEKNLRYFKSKHILYLNMKDLKKRILNFKFILTIFSFLACMLLIGVL